jgi:alkyl hydroperoxide reductase subunit AhpC
MMQQIERLIHWWQEHPASKPDVVQRLDKIDREQTQIGRDLNEIKRAIDPLYELVNEMRATPEGWHSKKKSNGG